MTREEILRELTRLEPWFHYIDLGNGLATKSRSAIGEPLQHPLPTWNTVKVCLPTDLSGQTVLDVGCNAGFYSIEMKRRGATRVLGIDSQRDLIRQALFVQKLTGVDVEYQRMSVYDLNSRTLGQFDITLALGLIYHCKHLVLALEKLFLVTRKLLVLETAIYPPDKSPESFAYPVGAGRPILHPLAYIENPGEAKEAIYNWFLPSTAALTALLKNIGFADVKVFAGVQSDRAVLACSKLEAHPDSRMVNYLGARLALKEGPTHTKPKEVLRFLMHAENTGHARWLKGEGDSVAKGDVHLAVHLLNKDEEPIVWYYAGAMLPHNVEPSETVEIEILLPAPDQPGSYVLDFDMVAEHLAWFEDLGSVSLKQDLIVD